MEACASNIEEEKRIAVMEESPFRAGADASVLRDPQERLRGIPLTI